MLRRDRELQYCFYVVACTGSAVFVLVAKHAAEQITAFQGARPVAAQFVSRLLSHILLIRAAVSVGLLAYKSPSWTSLQ